VLERLAASALLPRLRTLELSHSLMTDAGLGALTAERFGHLEAIRLFDVPASQAKLDALAATLKVEGSHNSVDSVRHFVPVRGRPLFIFHPGG
jgi:hypothetical protein